MNIRRSRYLIFGSLPSLLIFCTACYLLCLGPTIYSGHGGFVNEVILSPDGTVLASYSCQDNMLILWDVAKRGALAKLLGLSSKMTFSPNGSRLAVGGIDTSIKVFDVSSGAMYATIQAQKAWTSHLAFSPDGKILAWGNKDNSVILWDVSASREVAALRGHLEEITCLAFSPDSAILATGDKNSVVKLWDVNAFKEWTSLVGEGTTTSLAFSPDGMILVAGTYSAAKLWDMPTCKERFFVNPNWGPLESDKSSDPVRCIAFSLDGKHMALSSDEVIGLWEIPSGQMTCTFGQGHHPLSPTIVGLIGSFLPPGVSGPQAVWSVLFTPEGRLMAYGNQSNNVMTWQVERLGKK